MADKYDQMRDELSKMTMGELKEIAKREGITLGYASARKTTTVNEIVSWRRSRDLRERQ